MTKVSPGNRAYAWFPGFLHAPYNVVGIKDEHGETEALLENSVHQRKKRKNFKKSKKISKKVLTNVYLYGSIQKFAEDNKFEANGR